MIKSLFGYKPEPFSRPWGCANSLLYYYSPVSNIVLDTYLLEASHLERRPVANPPPRPVVATTWYYWTSVLGTAVRRFWQYRYITFIQDCTASGCSVLATMWLWKSIFQWYLSQRSTIAAVFVEALFNYVIIVLLSEEAVRPASWSYKKEDKIRVSRKPCGDSWTLHFQ